jgi:hypothetical protein
MHLSQGMALAKTFHLTCSRAATKQKLRELHWMIGGHYCFILRFVP